MYNIPIAPRKTPHSAAGQHIEKVNIHQQQDENIVYTHKGKHHKPSLVIDIVTRHK
jgi:hypothetical protein